MSKADKDEQIDEDILQCKADVLRARDIIPGTPQPDEEHLGNRSPGKQETRQKPMTEEVNESPSPASSTESAKKEEIPHQQTPETPAKAAGTGQEKSEIPRFDLAEEIMAEQRKITAIRRKAPGEKTEAEAEPADRTIVKPAPRQPCVDKIIAEIVAGDIERLLRGGNPADST